MLEENKIKISGFTFIKNGIILGYPFIQSIKSVLPIVDEFVINIGDSEDQTLEAIKSINSKKIKLVRSSWNDVMRDKGYVYGQQKMISQFNCTGDWVFYVEGDEVYHEKDLEEIKYQILTNHNNNAIEALAVNFFHFYGNCSTYMDSPGWYRSEVRLIRNNIRTYAPDGLFWVVLDTNKNGRYPFAKKIKVHCYHYGWVRSESQMNLKSEKVSKYWNEKTKSIDYSQMDKKILRLFSGTHPGVMSDWVDNSTSIFQVDSTYIPTFKQKKHRLMMFFERLLGVELSKKHYKLAKG